MPDQDTAVAPAAAPAPSPAPESPQPSGMDRFMSDVMTAVETPEKAPTTPEPKPRPEAAKPQAPKTEPETKPATKPDAKSAATPSKEDAGTLRKRLAEVANSEKTLRQEIEAIKKQNQELTSRRVVTPEMEAEIEANKNQIREYQQRIAEALYERSDEFRQQYREPWDNMLKQAVQTATQYRIEADDGTARAATPQDFWKVAGAHPAERAAIARQLFGDNALNVLSDVRDLERLKAASDRAIEQHRNGWQGKQKAEQERWQNDQRVLNSLRENARKQLEKEYPKYFGETDDPEDNDAYKAGLEFMKHADRMDQMTPQEKADYGEVLAARLAFFPRSIHRIGKLETENASLKAELAKYRKADPGGGEAPDARQQPVTATDDEAKGIESLAERVERAARGE